MQITRRFALAATGGLLAATQVGGRSQLPSQARAVDEALAVSGMANAALMRGDIDTYRKLITLADDFTFMSPFGGKPSHRSDFTEAKVAAMGKFFSKGSFRQSVVGTYASGDLAVLALVEHQNVEVGGLPAQEWPLRVTLVYRRVGSKWQLAHRHADPLLGGISVEEAADLARR